MRLLWIVGLTSILFPMVAASMPIARRSKKGKEKKPMNLNCCWMLYGNWDFILKGSFPNNNGERKEEKERSNIVLKKIWPCMSWIYLDPYMSVYVRTCMHECTHIRKRESHRKILVFLQSVDVQKWASKFFHGLQINMIIIYCVHLNTIQFSLSLCIEVN